MNILVVICALAFIGSAFLAARMIEKQAGPAILWLFVLFVDTMGIALIICHLAKWL